VRVLLATVVTIDEKHAAQPARKGGVATVTLDDDDDEELKPAP
jgi:hypothetical protein